MLKDELKVERPLLPKQLDIYHRIASLFVTRKTTQWNSHISYGKFEIIIL